MSEYLGRSQRENAGKSNYFDDYVLSSLAPREYTRAIQDRVQSEPDFTVLKSSYQQVVATQSTEKNNDSPMEESRASRFNDETGKSENRDVAAPGSSRCSSKVSDSARQSTKKSERSKVSSKRVEIERRRLALETEVARAELMLKKQELENQIRILDLQKGLAEAEIEEGELCSVQSKSSRKLYTESLGGSSRNEVVQEWVNKCEVHSDHHPREKLEKQVNEKVVPIDKTLHEHDLSKLCNVIADAVKSVSGRNQFDRDLSIFDGKPEDWPLFISQFHRKTRMYQYSEDEVMLKLQKCLKGEALEAVRSLLLHPKNISCVIDTLVMRFGRPEYIIASMISKTQNLQYLRDGDFNSFIKFSCHINNLVATLEQFEASNHLENPFLLEQLVSKIPNSMKLQWGQVIVQKRGKVNLKDFGTWANEVSSAACYGKMMISMKEYSSAKKAGAIY
ncbi:hypothetical protein JTB14_005248 [Gonioctena quinquepunctata]|nr:hypothetical protein JTB14_005248 [Gonioctena quinquepunctata]